MTIQRWEVWDHTAGGYCDPHDPAKCKRCREYGNEGEYVRFEDVEWLIGLLNKLAYPERFPESQSGTWHTGDGPFEQWAGKIAEEWRGRAKPAQGGRVITRVMDDTIKTRDGMS